MPEMKVVEAMAYAVEGRGGGSEAVSYHYKDGQ